MVRPGLDDKRLMMMGFAIMLITVIIFAFISLSFMIEKRESRTSKVIQTGLTVYSNGEGEPIAYACIDEKGFLFRSDEPCVPKN